MSQTERLSLLSESVLQGITTFGGVRRYPAKAIIITEGDWSDSLYVVLSGRVKVFTSDSDGRELIIATHGRGEYVGEMAIDGLARSASVATLEASVLSVIKGSNVRELLATQPEFALHLVYKLIGRARQATIGMTSLAFEDVHERVLRMLEAHSVPVDDYRVVRDRMTHREVGEHVGASSEMVSRVLKDLTSRGFIRVESGQIKILKDLSTSR